MSSRFGGFTLLELLIALAIFAIMATLAYTGLSNILESDATLAQKTERLRAIQRTFNFLTQDVRYSIMRPIRNEFGDTQPALAGQPGALEFTREGWSNPLDFQRSTLQRVAYYLENSTLYRSYWRVLDRARDSEAIRTPLLSEISQLKIRYLDETLNWHNDWPPKEVQTGGFEDAQFRLNAVEISLILSDWGLVSRLYSIPLGPSLFPKPSTPSKPDLDQQPDPGPGEPDASEQNIAG